MLLDFATLVKVVPLTATLQAILIRFFLFGRHSGGYIFNNMRKDSLYQGASKANPECRPLRNQKPASANPQYEDGDGGYLQPIHAFGLLGTM